MGSGKSFALIYEALFLAALNPGLPGLVGAPTYPMLRDATQRTLFDVLDTERIRHAYHRTENIVELPDAPYFGSEILFRSLDDYERLRGTNLAWFGIDELTYCKEEAWTRLEARLRHVEAQRRCGFAVWTPKGFDWVYDRFIGPEALRGYRATLARPAENRYLPADFYATLSQSYDAKFAAQEILGQYLSLQSGQTYYAFDRTAHLVPTAFSPTQALCWSLDFNVNPMCSVIAQLGVDKSVYILDEICLPNSNTQEACNEFWRRAEPWVKSRPGARANIPMQLRVYGDAAGSARSTAGKSDYVIIKEFFRNVEGLEVSYHVPSANPAVRDRVNAMNSKLKNAAGVVGMAIDPKCKRLVKDLEQVVWKADANGNTTGELDKRNKDLTHVSDALGYLVEQEFGIREKQQLFGMQTVGSSLDPDRQVDRNFERPSGWRMPGMRGDF